MTILQELKLYPADAGDIDSMIFYTAVATSMITTYNDCGLEPPDWLVEKNSTLRREIAIRQRDNLASELKKTELALDSLRTAEEKRSDLRAKAERLKAQLNK